MPYIVPERRDLFCNSPNLSCQCTAGELNFVISRICHQWLLNYGVNYTNINTVIGVLECAKLELYRQIAAPYENEKKSQNGPVSSLDAKT